MVYNSTMTFVGDTSMVFLGFMKHHWGKARPWKCYGYMMIMMGVGRDIT